MSKPESPWKAGSFRHLADDVVEDDPRAAAWIRSELLGAAGSRTLIEKSPVNCLRPDLVHRVFPDARFVQTHRDVSKVLPSVADLYFTMLQMGSPTIDPMYVDRAYYRTTWRQTGRWRPVPSPSCARA